MAFKLVIKDNLKQGADDFSTGDVRHFSEASITVGSASDCDCELASAEDIHQHHFTVSEKDKGTYQIKPTGGETIYVNYEPVNEVHDLASGDEIRVGHYTFRFQREHRRARPARRADIFAITAKIIIVCLLAIEVFFVYWLPSQIQSKEVLSSMITQQKTVMLLDEARSKIRPAEVEDADQQKAYALQLVQSELDAMARFIRNNEKNISENEWRRLNHNIKKLASITAEINQGTIFKPLPKPRLAAGVRGLLKKHKKESSNHGE